MGGANGRRIRNFRTRRRRENEYLLLVVDKASKFPFAYPLPSKEAHGVARLLLDLCLTFGVSWFIRADGGGELTAAVMEHLCR